MTEIANAAGRDAAASLPEPLRSSIANRFPMMRRTPEFDDPRPFQTSWDSLRKALDAERAAGAAQGATPR